MSHQPPSQPAPARQDREAEQPQHTPGPWRIVDSIGLHEWAIESESDEQTQGLYHGRRIAYIPQDSLRASEANARLIVAAPDMLAACEAALEWLSQLEDLGGARPVCEQLRTVIAKAKGGQS